MLYPFLYPFHTFSPYTPSKLWSRKPATEHICLCILSILQHLHFLRDKRKKQERYNCITKTPSYIILGYHIRSHAGILEYILKVTTRTQSQPKDIPYHGYTYIYTALNRDLNVNFSFSVFYSTIFFHLSTADIFGSPRRFLFIIRTVTLYLVLYSLPCVCFVLKFIFHFIRLYQRLFIPCLLFTV